MAEWVTGFVVRDVGEVHLLFRQLIAKAEELELLARRGLAPPTRATLAELRRQYAAYSAGLRDVAVTSAAEAQKGMRQRFDETRSRGDTGTSPHLRNLIISLPASRVLGYETGAVNIASVNSLNRAINRNTPGYGPYWRAQEYGTGSPEVESQIGRVIHGVFTAAGGGDPTPPISEYAGGGGPHPVFLPSRTAADASGARAKNSLPTALGRSGGGFGTIGHEVPARHFIRDGKDQAGVRWRASIDRVGRQAIDRLAAIGL